MSWEERFADVPQYYPGSSRKIVKPAPGEEKPPADQGWDSSPRVYNVGEIAYEFFTIGDLAAALNRKPVTIRYWESSGIIPVTPLRSPSTHPTKRHRIYSRALVEGIRKIAAEEGILEEDRPRFKNTRFRERTLALFQELSRRPLYGANPVSKKS